MRQSLLVLDAASLQEVVEKKTLVTFMVKVSEKT
jgi:hypothetical protein